ncbi:MAG: hypothetical protein P8Z75_14045 [Gammaproteobacteria bacterium]|jgi:hypothetical protein
MRNIRQLFSRESLDNWLLSRSGDSSRTGLILAATATILGYVLYAVFPLMTVIGALTTASIVTSASTVWAWVHGVVWLLLTAAFGLISFTQLSARISLPSGLGLKEDKAPRLYELLSELAEHYQHPKIHRLIIHDKFSLELIQVPRFGLPFLTTNVLYVGLPILQALSPAQFRGALARVLGQSSSTHNKKTHWVYRWHQFCVMGQRATRKHQHGLYRPLQQFFRLYTPFHTYWAADGLRQDALEADVYAMEIMNDSELADVILRSEVCDAFLKNKYWPKIYAMLRKNPGNPAHLPHLNMAKVLRNALTENEFAQTMNELINQEPSWRNIRPVLHERLNNIGQTKLDMPPPVMETAAQRYLGEAQGAVIKLLDKQWLARHGKPRSSHQKKSSESAEIDAEPGIIQAPETSAPESTAAPGSGIEASENSTVTVADRKRLAELKQKAQSAKLSDDEAWETAYLTEKLEDTSLAINLYQQILKHNPNHARTLFAVGRIMLTRMDQSGVRALERAMELDNGCVAQGCWMLAKFYKNAGDDARSRHYLERAAKIAA